MEEKVASYTGGLHVFKSYLKEKWGTVKEQGASGTIHELKEKTGTKVDDMRERAIKNLNKGEGDDYSHIYRRKSRMEMIRISAAVMGIEFCYAAETAFVSPTLLQIGVSHRNMTLIWCLSPFIGFFLTPIFGSLSDNCRSKVGTSKALHYLAVHWYYPWLLGLGLGDVWAPPTPSPSTPTATSLTTQQVSELMTATEAGYLNATTITKVVSTMDNPENFTLVPPEETNWKEEGEMEEGETMRYKRGIHGASSSLLLHVVWILMLMPAKVHQGPYLLDITVPEDHAVGLSTFTVMAGLGGGFGYVMGAINWDKNFIGTLLGGNVRAVFTIVTFIFIGCVFSTLYSFREIPLDILQSSTRAELVKGTGEGAAEEGKGGGVGGYGSMEKPPSRPNSLPIINGHGAEGGGVMVEGQTNLETDQQETSFTYQQGGEGETAEGGGAGAEGGAEEVAEVPGATLRQYLLSIVYMPKSLRVLCLTNLFCWMSLVCYSLYFTDFVGEAVFGGDPQAREGSREKQVYEEGVRFGCWGMALYSLSCSFYSFMIEKLVKRFGARPVYIYGQLVYSVGMVFMAIFRHPAAVIIFSCCAGVMYSTLFTMPYLLVAHYHASQMPHLLATLSSISLSHPHLPSLPQLLHFPATPSPTPPPPATPTPTPSPTPLPPATPTPTPSPTPLPPATPTPTPSPTPLPPATPTPSLTPPPSATPIPSPTPYLSHTPPPAAVVCMVLP
ncbi:hypothetical protein Pcinc_044220 [Petrolisthes cinctipes]|uniref:Uncharacterized protein n=1 Tax=Petrolisthes cinctipes TaxID=88211 RepID=A0AAE1BE89_PETCI|nr:hypothetical protein Pcinc_044220 [Petrolisthes cinctipes]